MINTTISSINSTSISPSESIKPSLKAVLQSAILIIAFILVLTVFLIATASPSHSYTDRYIFFAASFLLFFQLPWEALNIISTRYQIQDNEIQITRTILSSFTQTIDAAKINSVYAKQNPLDRLLGIGNVIITTSSGERVTLEALPNPHEIAELIRAMKVS